MLAQEVVRRVERLLAEGQLSQRKIARLVGISRGTVGAIAGGRRPDYEALRRRRQQREAPRPTGPPRRCPTCGAMVTSACLACELRRRVSAGKRGPHAGRFEASNAIIELELRDEHRRRYERIRARRRTADRPATAPDDAPSPLSCGQRPPALTLQQLDEALEYEDLSPCDDALLSDPLQWQN